MFQSLANEQPFMHDPLLSFEKGHIIVTLPAGKSDVLVVRLLIAHDVLFNLCQSHIYHLSPFEHTP